MLNIKRMVKEKFLFFDGAMGTMLEKKGINKGEIPDLFNILKPQLIREIHEGYLDAGADIITSNTFGANEFKLEGTGFSVEEVVKSAVSIAKEAINGKNNKYVALDIGPIGKLIKPLGELEFEKAYDIFKRQVVCGVEAGCDAIIIETMSDLYEAKAAVLAAKENSDVPVFCTMTFTENKRTFTGTDPITMVAVLEGLGVDALGINCSLGPQGLIPILSEILMYSSIPVIVQPNAGIPRVEGCNSVYDVSPECFGSYIKQMAEMGACILGGCCGTTYEYIRIAKQKLENMTPNKILDKEYTLVTSWSKTVNFNNGIVVAGERINPTGKQHLKEALRKEKYEEILKEAILQKNSGADILDVNVGLPDINEEYSMVSVVRKIQENLDIPLQIDSSKVNVLETATRIYNGKPIINSVNGSEKSMKTVFPIVKHYGACVVGLTLDDAGVPLVAEERYKIAERIVNSALTYGISKKDIIIDCLTLTVSSQQKEVKETLKTLRMVKERLGVKTILGISNISYGIPRRDIVNRTFFSMALENGLDCGIIDPTFPGNLDTVFAYNLLSNRDYNGKEYLKVYSGDQSCVREKDEKTTLQQAVIQGLNEEAINISMELLHSIEPVEILNEYIIPALDDVGKMYESQDIFLPQLMQSADVVKNVFEMLKNYIKLQGKENISKGKIVIATVSGDMHDIGKNIVKIILENYGFTVIDLGKNVDTEKIIQSIITEDAKLLGLSALMTTTVSSMEEVIKEIRLKNISCKVMVGGAVLNENYAKMIGADFYAKDALESVEIAKKVFV